jgi:iron complex transport system substrate-binding protein
MSMTIRSGPRSRRSPQARVPGAALPFGWIDAPPSINRVIGLRWIAGLLYPERFPEDIRVTARDFIKLFYQADVTEAQLDRILAGAQPGGRGR